MKKQSRKTKTAVKANHPSESTQATALEVLEMKRALAYAETSALLHRMSGPLRARREVLAMRAVLDGMVKELQLRIEAADVAAEELRCEGTCWFDDLQRAWRRTKKLDEAVSAADGESLFDGSTGGYRDSPPFVPAGLGAQVDLIDETASSRTEDEFVKAHDDQGIETVDEQVASLKARAAKAG